VALNAERAEEERRAIIRWLRPELQNPTGSAQIERDSLRLCPGMEAHSTRPASRGG